MSDGEQRIERAIEQLIEQTFPGAELLRVRRFGTDVGKDNSTTKATGYGKPLRIDLREADGSERTVVLHTATPNPYGHDRRADRAAEMLLAYDTFALIPQHVRALDVGAITHDGQLVSLRRAGELYVLTSFAPGHLYAEELRRIEKAERADEKDLEHARALARYLAELHRQPIETPPFTYTRAIRDLVGSGEGIFGIVDGYPPDTPGAPPERLQAIEQACLRHRWKVKHRSERRARIHGDFHPFNVLFSDSSELGLLDASRGCVGDPADDVTCLAINYVFFALGAPRAWERGFRPLWELFFEAYLAHRPDDELFDIAPAYFAWRALVVASPKWYPEMNAEVRSKILGMAERALADGRLDPTAALELFS